jgi:hypothetical protein
MFNSQYTPYRLGNDTQQTVRIPTVDSIKKKKPARQVCLQSEKESSKSPTTENNSDETIVWGWTCRPKKFTGPSKYRLDNLATIPTGSLYFASRKGPLSEMNARITGCPYDTIGIVFQSRTPDHEGTYIYAMDSSILRAHSDPEINSSKSMHTTMNNKVVVTKMADLIRDDSIIHHAILPLKDCDEEYYGGEASRHYDSHKWKVKMRENRNEIFRNLFKKYRDLTPEYDAYQTLASIASLPVSESLRKKNSFTSAELVGMILFEAGLIWDDRFSTNNRNPICGYDKCFFQRLAGDELNESDLARIALITPGSYNEQQNENSSTSFESDSYSQPGWDSDSEEQTSDQDPFLMSKSPLKRKIHAKTIYFGSLNPIDFLRNYYQTIGICQRDMNGQNSTWKTTSPMSESQHEFRSLVGSIETIAKRNEHPWKNQLNMSWYHDHLISIELLNDSHQGCWEQSECESKLLRNHLENLNQNFLQKRILHEDSTTLNENRLLRICRQTSELAAELHNLACQCQSHVVSKQHDRQYPAEMFDSDGNDQTFKFLTLVEPSKENKKYNEYLLILHRYMWGGNWEYEWSSPLKADSEKYYQLTSRLKRLLGEIVETRNRTPINCILLEVLVCLQREAHRLYEYILSCQKYTCTSDQYQRYTKRDTFCEKCFLRDELRSSGLAEGQLRKHSTESSNWFVSSSDQSI